MAINLSPTNYGRLKKLVAREGKIRFPFKSVTRFIVVFLFILVNFNVIFGVGGPEVLTLEVNPGSFSPDGDGKQDNVTISAEFSEEVNWEVLVLDPYGQDATRFSGRGKTINMPWNGWGTILGGIVPDGRCIIVVNVFDAEGNLVVQRKTEVIVEGSPTPLDPSKPVRDPFSGAPVIISLVTSSDKLSPDGDGVDDEITITAMAGEEVEWYVYIRNETGASFEKMWGGIGKSLNIGWNGSTDLSEGPVPNGTYSIVVTAYTDRGKTERATIIEVLRSPTPKDVSPKKTKTPIIKKVEATPRIFSPNGDGIDDNVTVTAEAKERVKWRLLIKGAQDGLIYLEREAGEGSFLEISWDGLDDSRTVVPSQNYIIWVLAEDSTGLVHSTGTRVNVKDTPTSPVYRGAPPESPSPPGKAGAPPKSGAVKPPVLSNVEALPSRFSPNGDGVDDSVVISAEASEEISEWLISIVEVEDKEPYEKRDRIKGKNLKISWDGISPFLKGTVPDGKYLVLISAEGEGGVAQTSLTIEVVDSPNKKTLAQRIPKERIEEALGGITISEIDLPGVIKRGGVISGTVTFQNAEDRDRTVSLTMSLKPLSNAVSIAPDRIELRIPAKSSAKQEIKILPERWANGGDYALEIRLVEGGEDIYYGAIPFQISRSVEKPPTKISSETLVVVRSDILVDFVTAQSYARPNNAPVIKLNPGGLTGGDLKALKEYFDSGIKKAVIVGGPVAVPQAIEYQLTELGFLVERIGGANRFETSTMVALLWEKAETTVIANGEDETAYSDAYELAIRNKVPLLLSTSGNLPESILNAIRTLGVKKVIIGLGIKAPVVDKLREMGVEIV